jgi:ribosomal protein S27AE
MEDCRKDVRWSPRVSRSKLRRLYERACQGIWDEELINDVGMTLYLRCRDILRIHRAQAEKKVTCPRCARAGTTTLIDRHGDRWTPMTCPACGWTMTWVEYHATFQRRQLNPGGAVTYFGDFIAAFERSPDPRERMLAIDRVIHEFHYSLRELPDQPTRAAGVNLIDGKLGEVVAFLNELGGMPLAGALVETDKAWHAKQQSIRWDDILARKRKQGSLE